MFRLFVLFIFFLSFLHADIQNVELMAKNVQKVDDNIEASGDVVIYSERYLITADRAIYNEKTGDLELFENVNILRGVSESSRSEHAKVNLKTDEADFLPFFLFDQRSDLWLQCDSAIGGPAFYLTKNAVVSSCNVQKPDWKIGFDRGKFNRQTSFLHLYNTLFYIQDVPVFYLPYFSFSTDKTRRTGLLVPRIGYSGSEGLYYQQPIYVAESPWWDLEILPQIRTSRGAGLYSTFRFVDSPYSSGEISLGKFRENSSYARDESLKNRTHEGYEVSYQRGKVISHLIDGATKDGLWLDFTYLNDIDYLNLQDNSDKDLDSLVTSRLNYYLSRHSDYVGLYAKYYIDTSKVDNDDTLQELPTLHYHRFLDSFLYDKLLYSIDTQYHRYDRKEGVRADHYEISIPISLTFSLFDEFVNFKISENIYASYVDYDKASISTEDYTKNYHQFSIYTDLARAYRDFFHTMYIGLDYTVPSWEEGEITEDFISTDKEYESLSAKLVQFFYDESGSKRIRHFFKQTYNFEKAFYKYGDLENELTFYISPSLSISNEIHYSHEFKRFSKLQSYMTWREKPYTLVFSHTYENEKNEEKENFLTMSFETDLTKQYNMFSKIDYDFEDNYMKAWQVGMKFIKKCWDYTLTYREDVTPKLTSAGSSSVTKRGIYLIFNLRPLGGISYDFSVESNAGSN